MVTRRDFVAQMYSRSKKQQFFLHILYISIFFIICMFIHIFSLYMVLESCIKKTYIRRSLSISYIYCLGFVPRPPKIKMLFDISTVLYIIVENIFIQQTLLDLILTFIISQSYGRKLKDCLNILLLYKGTETLFVTDE